MKRVLIVLVVMLFLTTLANAASGIGRSFFFEKESGDVNNMFFGLKVPLIGYTSSVSIDLDWGFFKRDEVKRLFGASFSVHPFRLSDISPVLSVGYDFRNDTSYFALGFVHWWNRD